MNRSPFRFEPRLEKASTLPSWCYFDSWLLDEERKSVFGRSWQLAGRTEIVKSPGDYFTAEIAGESLLIVRGRDSILRALSNVCRHRAGPVASGSGNKSLFQCGYHGWTYRLDGSLAGTPEMKGIECFEAADFALPGFPVEEWLGFVFVNLNRETAPLSSMLEDLPERLADRGFDSFHLAERKEWTIECNWKVYVDNYLEGYHIPIVHPSLFQELDYSNYRTETKGIYSIQHAPLKKRERLRSTSDSDKAEYFWIYPNLMLNVYPDNFSTNLIVPITPTRTVTFFEWFFADPERARQEIDSTVAYSDEIQIEDIEICETVQRNLASTTYSSGRFSPQRENGVHHFHGLLSKALGSALSSPPNPNS